MSAHPLKLIVGLGNPGAEYARTRHNAGFVLLDELARRHGGTFKGEPKYQADLARVQIGGQDVWLLKPMTYMNNSGGPTRSLATFYKIPPGSILAAYDELAFPVGTVKLKEGGGAAGHNGVRDLIAQLGEGFWRLRIGIGHPGDSAAGIDYVLGRPSQKEAAVIHEAIEAAADVVPTIIVDGPQMAMNRLHTRNSSPATEPPAK